MSHSRVIIDVREPFEYEAGHISGALNIPPADLMAGVPALDSLDKGTEIIVYCRTGSRSNSSIQILKQKGFTNIVNGINAEHVTNTYLNN